LTGSVPWGYRKVAVEVAEPDSEQAPYVRRLFELYACGPHEPLANNSTSIVVHRDNDMGWPYLGSADLSLA
jgi:hypothetical protein